MPLQAGTALRVPHVHGKVVCASGGTPIYTTRERIRYGAFEELGDGRRLRRMLRPFPFFPPSDGSLQEKYIDKYQYMYYTLLRGCGYDHVNVLAARRENQRSREISGEHACDMITL